MKIFSKGPLNQEIIDKLLKKLSKTLEARHGLRDWWDQEGYVYGFRKYRTMQSIGTTISNRTATPDNATNDQVYLKDSTNNFKKSTWRRKKN